MSTSRFLPTMHSHRLSLQIVHGPPLKWPSLLGLDFAIVKPQRGCGVEFLAVSLDAMNVECGAERSFCPGDTFTTDTHRFLVEACTPIEAAAVY
mgnify:CR=1 FL=1